MDITVIAFSQVFALLIFIFTVLNSTQKNDKVRKLLLSHFVWYLIKYDEIILIHITVVLQKPMCFKSEIISFPRPLTSNVGTTSLCQCQKQNIYSLVWGWVDRGLGKTIYLVSLSNIDFGVILQLFTRLLF